MHDPQNSICTFSHTLRMTVTSTLIPEENAYACKMNPGIDTYWRHSHSSVRQDKVKISEYDLSVGMSFH